MIKKIIFCVIVLCFLLSGANAYISGDTNGDSKITLSDVIYLVNFIFRSGNPPVPSEAGDVNASCTVTLSDVLGTVNYVLKGQPIRGCPAWGEAVNLGSLANLEIGAYSPSLSSPGLVLYFAETGTNGSEEIYQSIWNGFSWTQPVRLSSSLDRPGPEQVAFKMASLNTGGWDYGPGITTDGKVTWNGSDWGLPVRLGGDVNWSFAESPTVSADGLTLYYSRGTLKGTKTYVSYWKGTDWTVGEPLEAANAGGTAAGPQISYDNRTLYFYSDRPGSYGGVDTWVISR